MVADCHGGGGGGGGDFLIKLFGKTIPVPEPEPEFGDAKDLQQSSSSITSEQQDEDARALEEKEAPARPDTSDPSPQPSPEVVDADEDPNKSSPEETHQQPPGDGDGDGDAAREREKLKKPDKVLACPRCASMDTKFCYFNNYNVNQPRHFCKNCQRYWTADGAMRNVPVGAGRRKNKNAAAAAAAHFFHRARAACGGGDPLTATNCNGTVLSFGHGAGAGAPPACLDLAEQLGRRRAPPARNAGGDTGPCSEGSTNRDDHHSRPCADDQAAERSVLQQHPASINSNGWPPYGCAPSPAPAYFSSGIAIPVYPAAAPGYWGCMVPGTWGLPWPVVPPPTTTTNAPSVSSSSALGLGKHPRELDGDEEGRNGNGAGKVWAPKTMRIDDVDEVARSSIWSLIGIKGNRQQDDPADDAGGRKHKNKQLGMTVFEPKRDQAVATDKVAVMTRSSPLLHANPVALTRSVAFQEGSA